MTAPTFAECLAAAAGTPELVAEFDRLSGTHLSKLDQRSAIDAAIDEATGRDADALARFAAFVLAFVWAPLQEEGEG